MKIPGFTAEAALSTTNRHSQASQQYRAMRSQEVVPQFSMRAFVCAALVAAILAGQEVQTGGDDSSTVGQVRDCRLVLASETRVRLGEEMLSDSPLVYLSEGIIEAEVAAKSESRPVVIRSPFAEMRGVLGKFSFASLPDATFLETDSGTAQLTRKSDGHSIQVSRGKSVMIRANNGPLEPRAAAGRTTRPVRTMPIGSPVNAVAQFRFGFAHLRK